MKRIVIASMAGVVTFAVVFASASALTVNGGTVQAGGDTSLACDTDGVTLGWKTFLAGDGEFHVAGIKIVDIDPACNGQKVLVALFKTPTEQVGMFRGDIGGGQAEAFQVLTPTFTWVDGVSGFSPKASDVNSVQVLFKNFYVAYDAP